MPLEHENRETFAPRPGPQVEARVLIERTHCLNRPHLPLGAVGVAAQFSTAQLPDEVEAHSAVRDLSMSSSADDIRRSSRSLWRPRVEERCSARLMGRLAGATPAHAGWPQAFDLDNVPPRLLQDVAITSSFDDRWNSREGASPPWRRPSPEGLLLSPGVPAPRIFSASWRARIPLILDSLAPGVSVMRTTSDLL